MLWLQLAAAICAVLLTGYWFTFEMSRFTNRQRYEATRKRKEYKHKR